MPAGGLITNFRNRLTVNRDGNSTLRHSLAGFDNFFNGIPKKLVVTIRIVNSYLVFNKVLCFLSSNNGR